jgi:hypothetical protein
MPYWEDWIKRDSRFPLPEQISAHLMTPDEVEARLDQGENPFALSLEKWQRIEKAILEIIEEPAPLTYLESLRTYIGYKTCALCLESLGTYKIEGKEIHTGSDKCRVCALAKIDQCTVQGSQFGQIDEIMNKSPLEVPEEMVTERIEMLLKSVRKMIKNLGELKPSS